MLTGATTTGSWPVTATVRVRRTVVLPAGMPWPVTVSCTAVLPVALDAVAGETSLTTNVSMEIALDWVVHPPSGLVRVRASGPAGALLPTVTETVPEVPPPPTVTAPNVTPLGAEAEATTPACRPVPAKVTDVVVPRTKCDGDALDKAGAATIAKP